ncbi:MAG: Bug family tripartite tricarboxylate transporter substrate binding protein [Thermodesulfobacteriota bacterium]
MKRNFENLRTWAFIAIFAVILIGVHSRQAAAQKDVASFYKGVTMRLIDPHGPGGSYDQWVRAIAPHLKKHTGANVIIENMGGASGLMGGAYLYSRAKADGLTIMILPMPGMIVSDMLGFEQVKYELEKFSYIGRVEVMTRGFFASRASNFKTVADMQKSTKMIRFASVDPTSQSSLDASLISEGFSLKSKIIPGYKGSKEYMLALMAGREVDAAVTTFTGYDTNVKRGDLGLIAMMGKKRHPDFPETPAILEIPAPPEGKKLLELLSILVESGRMIVGPPGLPEEKRLFLENALSASMKEPALLDWAKKLGYNVNPLSSKECKELVLRLMEIVPKAERPKFKHLVTEKYF